MDEPWTLEWWSNVWIPAGLGAATVLTSAVGLFVALSSHRLARSVERRNKTTAEREAEAALKKERLTLVDDVLTWCVRRFPVEEPELAERPSIDAERQRLRARLALQPDSGAGSIRVALDLVSRAAPSVREYGEIGYTRMSSACLVAMTREASQWAGNPAEYRADLEKIESWLEDSAKESLKAQYEWEDQVDVEWPDEAAKMPRADQSRRSVMEER